MRALAIDCATGPAARPTEAVVASACRALVGRGISVRHPSRAAARADGWSALRLALADSTILVLGAAGSRGHISPVTRVVLLELAARIRSGDRTPRAAGVVTVGADREAARLLNLDVTRCLRGLGVMVPDHATIAWDCGPYADGAPGLRHLALCGAAHRMAGELHRALDTAAMRDTGRLAVL